MSIEEKIAKILAESKAERLNESNPATRASAGGDRTPIRKGSQVPEVKPTGSGNTGAEGSHLLDQGGHEQNPDNARNNVQSQTGVDTSEAPSNPANKKAIRGDATPVYKGKDNVKEDIDAMFAGAEGLSEEFKDKAATIFEAAVMSRVTAEVARLEEEFEQTVAEAVAQNVEGIVEQVDGYLGYIAEQWMVQNEIALERGIKSDILEGFVSGLKDLFEEHNIDIPEEQYDVLGEMQEVIQSLESKLDEQVEANVALTKSLAEAKRTEIVNTFSEGLTATEAEKLTSLVEEIEFEGAEAFETKVKMIRESYFTTKHASGVKSVVTDSPVELSEETSKRIDPKMSAYLSVLNNK